MFINSKDPNNPSTTKYRHQCNCRYGNRSTKYINCDHTYVQLASYSKIKLRIHTYLTASERVNLVETSRLLFLYATLSEIAKKILLTCILKSIHLQFIFYTSSDKFITVHGNWYAYIHTLRHTCVIKLTLYTCNNCKIHIQYIPSLNTILLLELHKILCM